MKAQARAYWSRLCEQVRCQKIFQIFKALHTKTLYTHFNRVLNLNNHSVASRADQVRMLEAYFGELCVLPGILFYLSGSAVLWNQLFTISYLQAAISVTKDTFPGVDGFF